MLTRFLFSCCASIATMTLIATTAVAQPHALTFRAADMPISARIREIGLPLVPLTLQEMSTETAQGILISNPTVAARPQGSGSVLLWDEVGSAKSTLQNSMSGTVTLNIVH